MKTPHDTSDVCEAVVTVEEPGNGRGRLTLVERQDLPPCVVDTQKSGRPIEPNLFEVDEERMNLRGPTALWPPDGVADANDAARDVASSQRLFHLVIHIAHATLCRRPELLDAPCRITGAPPSCSNRRERTIDTGSGAASAMPGRTDDNEGNDTRA